MSRVRTTISLTQEQFESIDDSRKKGGLTLSRYLVQKALAGDRSVDQKRVNLNDLDEVFDALTKGTLAPSSIPLLPQELVEAIGDYSSAVARMNGDFKQAHGRDDFLIKELGYPDDLSTSALQRGLTKIIKGLEDIGQVMTFRADSGADALAHLVRPGLVARRRIAYVYPFYRPSWRRPYWGIIKYGMHERTAILLKKSAFEAHLQSDWKDVIDMANSKELSPTRARAWFGEVINALVEADMNKPSREQAGIGFLEGFLEEELAEVIWSRAQSSYEYIYEQRRKPKTYSGKAGLVELLSDDSKTTDFNIFVCDLCDSSVVSGSDYPELKSKWITIPFPHGITIPVGIGFTLSFLPRLLVHNNWKKIKTLIDTEIDAQARAAISGCGVKIDEKVSEDFTTENI